MIKTLAKRQFFWLATWFEGGLVLLAYGLGWLASMDPLESFVPDPLALAYGLLGTAPLYLFFALGYQFPVAGLREIKEFLVERLGPLLCQCRWWELLYLGCLAGVTEEILFRGFVQPWLERDWGWIGGLVFSNMIFALLHWVTPLYALLAGLTGAYLGLAMDAGESRNLAVPIVIHAVYDFLAFLAVAQLYRRRFSA